MIINNKKYRLKELINSKEFTKDKIKINLILSKDISNISQMFKDCAKLLEISIYDDIIKIDDERFYKFEEFYDYNINYSKDIYENNFEDNNEDIYNKFYNDNINSINQQSKITKRELRETNHFNSTVINIKDNIIIYQYNYYTNMSEMFENCLSLSSLPDISKWNTINVIDMSGMFNYCSSLFSFPDISKWNTINVIDMSYMFNHCS